jgi:hypothetical protein
MGRTRRWTAVGALVLATGCGVRTGELAAPAPPAATAVPAEACPAGFVCYWPGTGRVGPRTQLSGDSPNWDLVHHGRASSAENHGDRPVVFYPEPLYQGPGLVLGPGDHLDRLPPAWRDHVRSSRWGSAIP